MGNRTSVILHRTAKATTVVPNINRRCRPTIHRPCRLTNHPNIINPCRPITSRPSINSNVIRLSTVTATTVVRNINRPTHHRPCPPTTHPSNISVILLRTVQAPDVVFNNHNHNSVVTKNVSSPAAVTTVARVAKVVKEDTTVVASDTAVTVAREAKVVKAVVVVSNPKPV